MFFFGNTFYCDFRDMLSKDYGEFIEQWVKENSERSLHPRLGDKGPLQHKSMEQMSFEELEIRFGSPYVYMHLGSCEHVVTFIDARYRLQMSFITFTDIYYLRDFFLDS